MTSVRRALLAFFSMRSSRPFTVDIYQWIPGRIHSHGVRTRWLCEVLSAKHDSHSLTTVSLSRFLLNMRGVAYRSETLSFTANSSSESHAPSLYFAQFVSSLGNATSNRTLDFDEEDQDVEPLSTDDAYTTSHAAAVDIALESVAQLRT